MPFSFSNISGAAIIFMVIWLSVAELIKHIKKQHHLEK